MTSVKFRILLLFSLISLVILSGCVDIFEDSKDNEKECPEKALIILSVKKMSSSSRSSDPDNSDTSEEASQDVNEEIQSLRFIMINAFTNIIEINKLIPSSEFISGVDSDNTLYTIVEEIDQGEKDCYLLANEEFVTNFTTDFSSTSSLTDILNDYQNKIGAGKELISLLNSISFSSEFKVENNSISLPYASYYRLKIQAGETYEEPLYLVPAATKYKVNITNKRKDKVLIKDLYVNSIADYNYLFPHVGLDNYYMDGTYWIDWLENVAESSQFNIPFEENQEFNDQWGWITDYQLPGNATHSPFNVVAEGGVEIDAPSNPDIGGEPIPGQKELPIFYKPESLNLSVNGKGVSTQSYSIKMTVQAAGSEEDVILTRNLSNVKALFRDTYLIINIEFNEGYMHVYGEIAPWIVLTPVNGYVTEETEQ